MRYRVIKTLVIYLLFATLEVWLHRCIGSGTGDFAQWARSLYLYRDPQNHKQYIAGLVDLMVPAIILGISFGTISKDWTPGNVTWGVLLLSAGIVGLFPIYSKLVVEPVATNLFTAFLKAVTMCGGIAYGSRVWLQSPKRLRPT